MATRRSRKLSRVFAIAMTVLTSLPASAQAPDPKTSIEAKAALVEARRLNEVASRLFVEGEREEALYLARRSVDLVEKAVGSDHPDLALSLFGLGRMLMETGDYARAEPILLRALAIREKVLPHGHPDIAMTLNNLGTVYDRKGDYASAVILFRRAVAICEESLGPEHPVTATPLHNLALTYMNMEDGERAVPLLLRALAIREKKLGPEHPDFANSLAILGMLYREVNPARAEPVLLRALAIRERALGPQAPVVAVSLSNLALLYLDRGDFARAEPLLRRALAIREKVLSPDHPDLAASLNNLAILYHVQDDAARAAPLFLRALAIIERTLGPEHRDVATTLSNLGLLYEEEGDYARAEPMLLRALAIKERVNGVGSVSSALALNNLGLVYHSKGDYKAAERRYGDALRILERAFGPDDVQLSRPLDNLSVLAMEQGRASDSIALARRSNELQDRSATVVLTVGSEEQKRLYMSTLSLETEIAIAMHVQFVPGDPDAAGLALTTLLRRKGRVLDVMTDSLAALRRSGAPDDQERLARLASIYSELSTYISKGPADAPPEQYRRNLASLQRSRELLEADVSQRNASFRAERRLVTLADVRAKIPKAAALIEIARYRRVDLKARKRVQRFGAFRYVAYVARSSGDPRFVDLGEVAPIDAAVDALRIALSDHDKSRDPKPAARALDRLLMQPIRAVLGDARWIFISPDGPLNLVPFGALVDEDDHYLVERYLFSYLTTGRDLIRFGDEHAAPRQDPLVLANPAFDDIGGPPPTGAAHRGVRSVDIVKQRLPSLESTVGEAGTIAQLFPKSLVLMGAKATEEAVKAAKGPLFMHLATHGFYLPEQPVPEVLLRGLKGEPTPAERAALLQRENPLLRSGIALAGFNRRESGADDGVLTALEVAGLDLNGTRLVVLSTCESGVGEATTGEGVYGLRRALTMAGSETQVMSLWQVDTGRTRELMQAYYGRLKRGAGRSEAMRDVQLAMLSNSETAHPNLWASFIVSGEWRTLDEEPRLPDLGKVPPGARGCSCDHAGSGEPRELGAWLAVALAVALMRRRS